MLQNIGNLNKKTIYSITELNRNETGRVYGGFGATTRHFISATVGWAILAGMYGIPTGGFIAASVAIPAVFTAVDIIDRASFKRATHTFAKKFNFGALSCLTLGSVLKYCCPGFHITTNVFTGFNITNEK